MTRKHVEFDTWGAFLDSARAVQGDDYTGRTWAGCSTVGEARGYAETGWAEGSALVESIALPMVDRVSPVVAESRGWGWDVTGETYDVGAYLSGAPECWLVSAAPVDRPVISIGVNTTTSAAVSTEVIQMRGVALVSLALALQAAGRAVHLYMVAGGESWQHKRPEDRIAMRTMLSDPQGGPLDTDRIMFALAHPACTRTLSYNVIDRETGERIGPMRPADPPACAGWTFDLYLPALVMRDKDWDSAGNAQRWVEKAFASLTGGSH